MKRLSTISIAGLALLISLLFAAPAAAAPALAVEMTHYPATVFKNDAFVGYEVEVGNTGADPTSGTLTVSVQLPQGLTLKRAEGTGWSCSIPVATCTSSAVVAAGSAYPTLDLKDVRIDDSAAEMPIARAVASGGGAPGIAFDDHSFLFDPPVPFELLISDAIAADEAGEDETQAGGHPYEASAVFETTRLRGQVGGSGEVPLTIEDLHAGVAELPVGVVGNPEAAEAFCEVADLKNNDCPEAAAVGGVAVFASATGSSPPDFESPKTEPVFRMAHERGFPASFGFKTINGLGPAFVVRAKARTDGDFGITTLIPLVPQEPKFFGANFAFCGFGAEVHQPESSSGIVFDGCKKRDDPKANTTAFVTLGTDCSIGEPRTRFAIDSWLHRGSYGDNGLPDLSDPNWKVTDVHSPELTGCEQLTEEWTDEKEPSFTMQPDSHDADSPAAYTAHLHIPQDGLEDPDGLGTSHLKDTVVTLPEGLSFNPSIAHRLQSCSLEQIGYLGNDFPRPNRIRFDTQLPDCPEASKVGTVKIDTPLLADPLTGSVFLAAQKDNPFASNYAIYISIEEEDLGVVAKLPGKVELDPETGQISATFSENPQLPFSDFELNFFGGDRSALANPVTCGEHEVEAGLSPWSAADPYAPQAHEIARSTDTVEIDDGANGAPCPSDRADRPFHVGLSAGSSTPLAGATSPFGIRITRPDGSQELDRLEISTPPGFVASLRGIPYCSEAQIAAAGARDSGEAEQRNPSCPPASGVGSTYSGAGPGPTPFFAPGKIYLAGPYKGAPLSVVAITPAVAGPYDLGNVVVRSALRVDPVTARITAITDPLPQVFEGIPLRLRDLRIDLDRPSWAQNPTSCEATMVNVTAFGSDGAVASPFNRYQVGGCRALGFKPQMTLRLKGGTRRGAFPSLRAIVRPRPGDANIRRAAVTLPRSAFLEQGHIRTICTRVQWTADTCPKAARYGYARAWSPLLDTPLQGPVYLRSSDNELPDLVADLRGPAHQPIKIEAAFRTDSVRGGIRSTLDVAPDAPVSRFVLRMQGGRKGLIVNSRNICRGKNRARANLKAHNGRLSRTRPVVHAMDCKRKQRKAKRGGHKRGR